MDLARMSGPRRFGGLSFLILLTLGFPAAAQSGSDPLPVFTKTQYQWGVLPLEDVGLEPSLKPLAANLMILLVSGWKNLPDHEFTVTDLDRFQKDFQEEKIKQEEKNLQDSHAARDALLFKNPVPTPLDYLAADEKIRLVREKLQQWKDLNPKTVGGGNAAPLKFISESAEKILLTPPIQSFSAWTKSKSLDLVVGGNIRSVKGYIFGEFFVWGPDQMPLAQWSGWFTPQDASATVTQVRGTLTPGLLGRLTTDLTLKIDPPTTRIYLDGELKGVGVAELPYWEPGDYILRLEGLGLVTKTETLSLVAGDLQVVERTMERESLLSHTLVSVPPGADVYLGSLWLGSTPLEIPVSTEKALVQFFYPDFEESSWSLSRNNLPPPVVTLEPLGTRMTALQAKDRFYWSLAAFSISFAGTAMIRGQELNMAQLWKAAGQSYEAGTGVTKQTVDQARSLYLSTYYGGWVGLGVTGLSALWMIWELINYISVGESNLYN
ncbi:MAG: hypothetical protein A2Z96_06340 [Spirochaetes bacterium GWB1_48_6]|nr:MAG: hypothetical protein A2Z96_06340 [Spirochaetes bacterium GWB1_48_6]